MTGAVLEALRDHVRDGGTELETGGILLGHETPRGWRVLVAGGPGPRAERHPLRFQRDRDHAQRLADDAWDRHRAIWLGEWHTHPFAPPIPSEVDMTSYNAHLADTELNFERFLSIIVGHPIDPHEERGTSRINGPLVEPTPGRLVTIAIAWVIDNNGATIAPLGIVEETT